MKSASSILVLADDLTGAAEIAAAGFARGLEAVVATGSTSHAATGELVVQDTDSRLLQPAEAARKIVSIGARCRVAKLVERGALVFKKTDSVLRGAVVAELDTLAAISRHGRILLVPGNPRLGRIIRDGVFYIGDKPITDTVFAHDPHHPARSASIVDLLGPPRRGLIQVIKPGDLLPDSGLIVGTAQSLEDVAHWAGQIDARTLPAGSSVFFEAILEARGHRRLEVSTPIAPYSGVLMASGTTAEATRLAVAQPAADGVPAFTMPEICATKSDQQATIAANRWTASILGALAQRGSAVALPPASLVVDASASARIRATFAQMITELHRVRAYQHLVVEGGSTAAMVVHTLKWNELIVSGELAPGVATLTPRLDETFRITLKPGSYPWPAGWWEALARARPRAS